VLLAGIAPARGADPSPAPLPPTQPTTGPAGSDYPAPGDPFVSGVDGLGGYTLYEPNPRPPTPVPLVLLLRGACISACNMTTTNNIMNAWREHLVKKGNVVVFPHYQQTDEPELEEARIVDALHHALADLAQPGHVTPDLDRFGIAGHSRGSQMTANLAAHAVADGIPTPRWLLIVEPGPTSKTDLDGLRTIPDATRVVVVVGEDDHVAGEAKAKLVWEATSHLPPKHRDYVRVQSDRRGVWAAGVQPEQTPLCETSVPYFKQETTNIATCATANEAWTFTPRYNALRNQVHPAAATGDLTADHFFPGQGTATDVFALWKLSQALVDCTGGPTPAARRAACAIATGGGGSAQTDMGTWSDGVAVKPLCVTDDPNESWAASCRLG
jgi:hypothetical protein